MKTRLRHYTDEFRYQVVQEYLETEQSQLDLMRKYGIKGSSSILNWMRKFGLEQNQTYQNEIQRTMAKETGKTAHELELEKKVKELEKMLEHEKLRTMALNTMIDIAEKELKISIRKKSGAKR